MNRPRRFPQPYRTWANVGILAVAIISIFSGSTNKESLWLSTSEAKKITDEPGALETLKYRMTSRFPKLWGWFYRKPLTTHTEILILNAPATLPADTGLGQPMATNSSGARLWVVPSAKVPEFYAKFRAESDTNAAYYWNTLSRITSANDISCFSTSRPMTYSGSWPPPPLPPPQDDIEIQIIPTKLVDDFKLIVAMKMAAPTSCTEPPFGFRMQVPKLGIVAVDGGKFKDRSGRPYWLLISPADAGLNASIFH